jgi:hypothetical protein
VYQADDHDDGVEQQEHDDPGDGDTLAEDVSKVAVSSGTATLAPRDSKQTLLCTCLSAAVHAGLTSRWRGM